MTTKPTKHFLALAMLLVVTTQTSCDFYRKKKCEWYMVPDFKHKSLVKPDWVSLCLRNYTSGKQVCLYQAHVDFAERMNGVKFRFVDMKIEKGTHPRVITDVKTCN